jgi:hypothetical protein
MDGLGIEFISVFGLPPVQFVSLAADLARVCSSGRSPSRRMSRRQCGQVFTVDGGTLL